MKSKINILSRHFANTNESIEPDGRRNKTSPRVKLQNFILDKKLGKQEKRLKIAQRKPRYRSPTTINALISVAFKNIKKLIK